MVHPVLAALEAHQVVQVLADLQVLAAVQVHLELPVQAEHLALTEHQELVVLAVPQA